MEGVDRMKSWALFTWAVKRLEFDENGHYVKSFKNDFLVWLMNLSGVKHEDVYRYFREN